MDCGRVEDSEWKVWSGGRRGIEEWRGGGTENGGLGGTQRKGGMHQRRKKKSEPENATKA